jgi:hypothetical protein
MTSLLRALSIKMTYGLVIVASRDRLVDSAITSMSMDVAMIAKKINGKKTIIMVTGADESHITVRRY